MKKEDCPFSLEKLNAVVREIEALLGFAIAISLENASKRGSFFEAQASTIFSKSLMSLIGFLRFIPPSQYYADRKIKVVDLSSASGLARQLMHDAATFFYLTEVGVSDEDLRLRITVWNYHGIVEAGALAVLAVPESKADGLSPEVKAAIDAMETSPAFQRLEKEVKGRIRKGQQPLVLSNQDVMNRRGISKEAYLFSLKAFSNFVHPSALSILLIEQATAKWEDCYQEFYQVICYVAAYSAELTQAFVESVPECQQIPPRTKSAIEEYRKLLRSDAPP